MERSDAPGNSPQDILTGLGYWVPFASRTAAYGLASCVGGPLTRGEFSLTCMRRWCVDSLAQLEIDVEASGVDRVRAAGPSVIVANHNSVLDILVLGAVLGVDYKWAAKRSLFRVPFLGWHLALAGHIPVDRDKKHAMRVLDRAFARTLRAGNYLLIFPEGTRSVDSEIRSFKMGAFVTAVRNQVPIVPVVIDGTASLMEKGRWTLCERSLRKVKVRVLHPIQPRAEGETSPRAIALREQTRRVMVAGLDQMRGRTKWDSSSLIVV